MPDTLENKIAPLSTTDRLRIVRGMSPDKEAEAYNISVKANIPMAITRDSGEELKYLGVNQPEIPEKSGLKRFLDNSYTNTIVAQDDIENLKNVESLSSKIAGAWSENKTETMINELIFQRDFMGLSPDTVNKYIEDLRKSSKTFKITKQEQEILQQVFEGKLSKKEAEPKLRSLYLSKEGMLPQGFAEKLLVYPTKQLPHMLRGAESAAKEALEWSAAFTAIAAVIGQVPPLTAAPEEGITIPYAASVGAKAGSAYGYAKSMFIQEYSGAVQEYSEFRDEEGNPIDPKIIKPMATIAALINAGLETFSVSKTLGALSKLPGMKNILGSAPKDFLRVSIRKILTSKTIRAKIAKHVGRFGEAFITEIATEIAQELSTMFLGGETSKKAHEALTGVSVPGISREEVKARLSEVISETAYTVLAFFFTGGAASYSLNKAKSAFDSKRHATDTKDINTAINQTKIKERIPEKAKEFLDILGNGGPIFISGDGLMRFYQDKIEQDADITVEKLGINAEEARAAASRGQDIEVPQSALHANLTEEEFESLRKDLKPAPGAYTLRELESQDDAEDMASALAMFESQVKEDRAVTKEMLRLKSELLGIGQTDEQAVSAVRILKGLADGISLEGGDRTQYLQSIAFKRTPMAKLVDVGKRLLQKDKREYRGETLIDQGKYVVTLFKKGDFSTVVHEIGHIALNEYIKLETGEFASDSLKQDMDTVRQFVGAEKGAELTRDQTEKIAKSFEVYLFEGKAPTKELTPVFERLKRFLTEVYKSIKALKIDLNDDMRGVFDRMLASSIEVDNEAVSSGFVFKTQKEMKAYGIDENTQRYMKNLVVDGTRKADVALSVARNKDLKNKKSLFRSDAEQEVKIMSKLPADNMMFKPEGIANVYDLINDIITGKRQLNEAEFLSRYGEVSYAALPDTRIVNKGGAPISKTAAYYGFENQADMVDFILRHKPFKEAVQEIYDKRVKENDATFKAIDFLTDQKEYAEYYDILAKVIATQEGSQMSVDEGIQRNIKKWETEASEEIKDETPGLPLDQLKEAIAQRVQEKIEAYTQNRRKGKLASTVQLKNTAKTIIEQGTVRNATATQKYVEAMKKAHVKELRAVNRKDWATAKRENDIFRLNRELARLSAKAKQEVAKIEKYAGKFTKKKPQLGADYKDAILHLLNRFGLTNQIPSDPMTFPDYGALFRIDELGAGFAASELVYNKNGMNYKNLSLEQLRSLYKTVAFLHNRGAPDGGLLSDGITPLNEVAIRCAEEISKQKPAKVYDQLSYMRKLSSGIRSFFAVQMNINFLTNALSGYKPLSGKRSFLREQVFDVLMGIERDRKSRTDVEMSKMKPHEEQIIESQRKLRKKYGMKISAKVAGVAVPKVLENNGEQVGYWLPEQIFKMAFHRMNQDNFDKLVEGYPGLTYEQVDHLLNKFLTLDDMVAVQGIVDVLNSLYPEVNEVHKRVFGFSMKKTEATPFEFKGKKFAGGYFPIVIDRHLANTYFDNLSSADDYFKRADDTYIPPFTRSSFRHERVKGHGLPISLHLSDAYKHIDEAIRFITHTEKIRDVDRITRHKDFKAMAIRAMGKEVYDQIRPNLKGIVNPQIQGVDVAGQKVASYLRVLASAKHIAINISSGLKQTFSLPGGIHDLGVKYFQTDGTIKGAAKGFQAYMSGVKFVAQAPIVSTDVMYEKSSYMKSRRTNFDRDFASKHFKNMTPAQKEISFGDKNVTWEDVVEFGYWPVRLFDTSTVGPLWWGAYFDALNQYGTNEDEAVAYADSIIQGSQPSSQAIDLSSWFRSGGMFSLVNLHQTFTTGVYGQRQRANFNAWRNKEITTGQYAWFNFMDAVAPMFVMSVAMSALRGHNLKDKETWEHIFFESVKNMLFTGIPWATRIIDAVVNGYRSGVIEIPGEDIVDDGVILTQGVYKSFTKDLTDKEKEKIFWSMINFVSDISGVPVGRVAERAAKGTGLREKIFGSDKKTRKKKEAQLR